MSKEVTTKKETGLTNYKADTDLLKMAPTIASDHLRLKKIKIHQGTTQGRKGAVGELYTTPDLAKLSDGEEKVVFYPLTYKLSWFHNKKGPNETKPTPTGVTPWKNANQFQWKTTETDGTTKQNFQTATFFGVLERDLEKGDVTPVQIVLSSTSFSSAALPLMNRYDELKRHGVEPWLCKFTLTTKQSPKGQWYMFNFEPVVGKTGQERADLEHLETLRKWTRTMLELQQKGELEASAEEMQADVEETIETPRAKPVPENELRF